MTKARWPRPDFRSRRGSETSRIKTQLVDGECFADDVYRTKLVEHCPQPGRVNPVDLQIPILRLVAHQGVANTTTDKQCSTACVANGFRQC